MIRSRIKFEESFEYYSFQFPSLPNINEFEKLKKQLAINPNQQLGYKVEVKYGSVIILNLILMLFVVILLLLGSGKFIINNQILNLCLIIFSIFIVLVLGASGFVFTKIKELYILNYPNKYFKSLKKLTAKSKNYDQFVKFYTEKYYKGISKKELSEEVMYINQNEGLKLVLTKSQKKSKQSA
tara:strand:- start:5670 stop:6218 length:549 start_codon:yes stop_codon:yes gene_type:complete